MFVLLCPETTTHAGNIWVQIVPSQIGRSVEVKPTSVVPLLLFFAPTLASVVFFTYDCGDFQSLKMSNDRGN